MTRSDEQKREIEQLLFVSDYYFQLVQDIKIKMPREVLSTSIKQLTKTFHENRTIKDNQRDIVLLTAHLGSCAVRLDTIEQILGIAISKKRLQKYNSLKKNKKNLTCERLVGTENQIIHFLLRNNIGHYEPHGISNNTAYNTMELFFKSLTPIQIFNSMKSVIKDIKADILKAGY